MKFLFPIKLLLLLLGALLFSIRSPAQGASAIATTEAIQQRAFAVLTVRCNTCHLTKNPRKVFTLDNMEGFKSKIRRQVFVFKRMPKGRERRKAMPSADYAALRAWIDHLPASTNTPK